MTRLRWDLRYRTYEPPGTRCGRQDATGAGYAAGMMRGACEHCGQVFTGRKSSARYCGDSCRKAAWRERTAMAADDVAQPSRAPLAAVAEDGPALVAEAVAASAHSGLVAVAEWLADTLDGLEGPARAIHGPKVASQLVATLKLLGRPAGKPEERPPSRLDRLRAARAASDERAGWTP